ncbi:peptidoglycan recognition family protein [Paenibacillus sp. UMB7766-LJ446]|uniref:peptidoglycan recognition protein family protein n=1 Tax=Paenibacillus sp. UMB7766-LJ446 TaxID=3046313 RepID=UPI0025503E0C|nr:peptidoglycan recognition family protein [Paenibacillus sp. UMB7766-LJ446]MDK8188763.1 peptidoglycan recognition family protein [Paenibacillus sp. UMB7766-LJ446]
MISKGNFLLLEPSEFKGWLDKQKITRSIDKIQVHHTAAPNYTTRQMINGVAKQDVWKCLEGMRTYHLSQGWSGTGQNITVLEDGRIAISLDRDLNKTPAGIKGANTGALCIEIIGNFDQGGDTMTAVQKQSVVHLYACLVLKLNILIDTSHIVYHAWYTPSGAWLGDYEKGKSSKTCPGTKFFGEGNTRSAAERGFIPAIKAELKRIKEGDGDPMTSEEKKQMEELKAKVESQAKWIVAQKAKENMECPKWAEKAYEFYKDYIADKTGSYDFWRQLVINYRKENENKVI